MNVKSLLQKISGNPLLKNSLSLMLASGLTAAFGFIFWIIAARSFEANAVGLATTLLSMATLLSLLSLVGFDVIFVKFLRVSKKPNEQITSGLILSGVATLVVTGIFCLLIPLVSSELHFVIKNPLYVVSFMLLTLLMTWSTLTNAVFVAYRRAFMVLVVAVVFGVVKVGLPLFVHSNNPMMIIYVVAAAQAVNLALNLSALHRLFDYVPRLKVDIQLVRETLKYGLAAYIANIINLLPPSVLPLIVINKLGSAAAAYFYVAFAIANLLYTIAFATNQVLLAEASHDDENVGHYMRKGLKSTSSLLLPAAALIAIFCPLLLSFFGNDYSDNATGILRLMCLGGVGVMFYSLFNFVFRHTKNLRGMMVMAASNTVIVLLLSLLLTGRFGLLGVGWAWIIGNACSVLIGAVLLLAAQKRKGNAPKKPQDIIISHVYSKDNKGDAALLSVLISDIRKEFGDPAITILTLDSVEPGETFDGVPVRNSLMFYAMKRFQSKPLVLLYSIHVMCVTLVWAFVYKMTGLSLPINKKLRDICQAYANTDLVLPVGGGYIRSQKKGIGSLLNVVLLLHPIKLSRILNKPTVLYTQSVGPFNGPVEERLIGRAFNNWIDAALIREDTSMELLGRLGVDARIIRRSIDSGFAFTSQGVKYDIRKQLGIKKGRLLVGVTARKWLSGTAQTNYEKALAKTATYLVQQYDAAVVFIPQVTAEFHGDDDRLAHRRIVKYTKNLPGVYALDEKLSHQEIKATYDCLDLVIGTRFHSVIFSLTSMVPAIAIEYEHKTGGIMHDLGLDKWVLKMEQVDAEKLCKLADELVAERREYKQKLMSTIPAYSAKTDNAIETVRHIYEKYTK